jgi:hypothetical protein
MLIKHAEMWNEARKGDEHFVPGQIRPHTRKDEDEDYYVVIVFLVLFLLLLGKEQTTELMINKVCLILEHVFSSVGDVEHCAIIRKILIGSIFIDHRKF